MIELYKDNGTTPITKTIALSSSSVTFTDLDKYTYSNGGVALSTYTVREQTVNGYNSEVTANPSGGFTVTNTLTQQYESKSGSKTWIDLPGTTHETVIIQLWQEGSGGKVLVDSAELANGVTDYTFVNEALLNDSVAHGQWPVFELNGSGVPIGRYTYTVQEAYVSGTTVQDTYTATVNGLNVTNTIKQTTTTVMFSKTWVDPYGTDANVSRTATFVLKQDGNEINRYVLTNSPQYFEYTFTTYLVDNQELPLPTYKDGGTARHVYTVEELQPVGYTSREDTAHDGWQFTNTIVQNSEYSVNVTKAWNGPETAPKPAEGVQVQLFKNGGETAIATITLSAPEWAGSFTGLEEFNGSGSRNAYTVKEVSVDDYTSAITGSQASGYVITNTYNDYKYQLILHYTTIYNGQAFEEIKYMPVEGGKVKGQVITVDPADYLSTYSDGREGTFTFKSGTPTVTISSPYEPNKFVHTIELSYEKVILANVNITVEHHFFTTDSYGNTTESTVSTVTSPEVKSVLLGSSITAKDYAANVPGYQLNETQAAAYNIASVQGGEVIVLNYYRAIGNDPR